MCFEKIAPMRRELISSELAIYDFFGAFKKLNAYYVRTGAGNIKPFEDEADSYRIQPGQDLAPHLEAIHQAFLRWASVSWLNSVLHVADGDPELTAMAIHVPERVCIWNANCMTDAEIVQANALEPIDPFNGKIVAGTLLSPILITESRRFNILKKSVIHSLRFRLVAQSFSSLNENERTVTSLVAKLRNQEASPDGVEALQLEQQRNPGYAAKILKYTAAIKAHALPALHEAPVTANLTEEVEEIPQPSKGARKRAAKELRNQTSGQSAMVTTVEKHCINHPHSISHTTAECIAGPKRARVETNQRPSNQTRQQPRQQNQQRAQGGTLYQGPPCNYCLTQRRYERMHTRIPAIAADWIPCATKPET